MTRGEKYENRRGDEVARKFGIYRSLHIMRTHELVAALQLSRCRLLPTHRPLFAQFRLPFDGHDMLVLAVWREDCSDVMEAAFLVATYRSLVVRRRPDYTSAYIDLCKDQFPESGYNNFGADAPPNQVVPTDEQVQPIVLRFCADQSAVVRVIADAVALKITDRLLILLNDEAARSRFRSFNQVLLSDGCFGRGSTPVPTERLAIVQPLEHQRNVQFVNGNESDCVHCRTPVSNHQNWKIAFITIQTQSRTESMRAGGGANKYAVPPPFPRQSPPVPAPTLAPPDTHSDTHPTSQKTAQVSVKSVRTTRTVENVKTVKGVKTVKKADSWVGA